MLNNQKFRRLVEADAKAIIDRQETDSIDIIDEIRYVLQTCDLTTSRTETGSMVGYLSRNSFGIKRILLRLLESVKDGLIYILSFIPRSYTQHLLGPWMRLVESLNE